jgi:hypothetical protein
MTVTKRKCILHAFVGVGQWDIGTRLLLFGCEIQVEGKVRRELLFKGRWSHSNMIQSGCPHTSDAVLPTSSNMGFRLSSSDNEHGESPSQPSNSLSRFRPTPSGARVTTSITISPSLRGPPPPGPNTISSTSHVRELRGEKTCQKRSGRVAGGGGMSCAVARCSRSAGGCATICASAGERRGARIRSRSGDGVVR